MSLCLVKQLAGLAQVACRRLQPIVGCVGGNSQVLPCHHVNLIAGDPKGPPMGFGAVMEPFSIRRWRSSAAMKDTRTWHLELSPLIAVLCASSAFQRACSSHLDRK